ncbi:MAG: CehA/McbA family metallohydrolase [Chloroflexota bacterium]
MTASMGHPGARVAGRSEAVESDMGKRGLTTDLAEALALEHPALLGDEELIGRLHPAYSEPVRRWPRGPMASRGLPLQPLAASPERRWLVVDRSIHLELGNVPATDLVLAHFCDAWRNDEGARPEGAPVGWVLPVGEPLAQVTLQLSGGREFTTILRRRFEVNEGIIGWGSMAFLAVPHLAEHQLDWRGPHERQAPGGYAAAGHSGPLTMLPGTWGANQTGVQDHVPSPTGDLTLWLHSIDIRSADRSAREVRSIDLEPIAGDGQGRLVVVAAITAFRGAASPLRWSPRRALRVPNAEGVPIDVDMGVIARRALLADPAPAVAVIGWGPSQRDTLAALAEEVIELTAAEDATLRIGDESLPLRDLDTAAPVAMPGGVSIEALAPPDRLMTVSIGSADGRTTPARVRLVARDGRVLPPLGHRAEVNPAIHEDSGADVTIRGIEYAYVDGRFDVEVPQEGALLEVVHGFEVPPVRWDIESDEVKQGAIDIRLAQAIRPTHGHWVSGDTHVHFLAPSTALLQAQAEGTNIVHLLATQWGNHHTGVTDLGADLIHPDGQHAVWVGSENRQNLLGHIGIVGTSEPILPFASGGPPEGPIGGAVTHLMADWLRRSRELGGLAIASHFPLPMAEISADIEAGLLDALELQCFDETLESPPIREWYRYLNAGYRLPLVGGTDKMSAEVPLGQVRTWARLEDDRPLDIASWAQAIRSGRTFVTSGPILELRVDGEEPGAQIGAAPSATLDVELRARAAQAIISGLEVIVDGSVVAACSVAEPVAELVLRERVRVERSGWIAGRSHSPMVISSAFATAMAAHTSPLYIEMPGRPRAKPDLSTPLAIVDGTRAWLQALAPVRGKRDAERFKRFLDDAERQMKERGR